MGGAGSGEHHPSVFPTRFMLNFSCICVVVTPVIASTRMMKIVTGLQDSDKPLRVMSWNSLTLAGAPNLMMWRCDIESGVGTVESIRLILRALTLLVIRRFSSLARREWSRDRMLS